MRNARPFVHVVPIKAALWHELTTVEVHDPGIGSWGLRVRTISDGGKLPEEKESRPSGPVPTTTLEKLIAENGHHVDLLKLDIEGSERDILANSHPWIGQVDAIVAELHVNIHADCGAVFDAATQGFTFRQVRGELVLARR